MHICINKYRSITLFSEELVRGGGCSFVLSSFLRKLDKAMREQGGGAMWQIISQGDPGAKGYMKQVCMYMKQVWLRLVVYVRSRSGLDL